MNAKLFNQSVIFVIALTLAALGIHNFLPKKRFSVLTNPDYIHFLYSTNNDEGGSLGYWIDQSNHIWGCSMPTTVPKSNTVACSFNILLTQDPRFGVDLSGYNRILVKIRYQGDNNRIRFYVRNFNPKYSRVEDPNSTKFNSLKANVSDIENSSIFKIDELNVADWWLNQYQIERSDAARDVSNAVVLGIDFEEMLMLGEHRIEVLQLDLEGEWISQSQWYLFILGCWLFGILVYSLNQLRILKQQSKQDSQQIYQLNVQNRKLLKQSDEFRRLSTVDPLTQTFNRFGIHQIINRLLETTLQDPETPCFTLMLIDIDYFKRINDRRGHDAGDRVLETVSQIILQRVRGGDFVGRWGGEEFLVILPDTKKEFSLALAEKIRLVIYDTIFEAQHPLNVTASFGIAEHKPGEDFATTFKRVDTALYAAKNQGRNCCVMAADD